MRTVEPGRVQTVTLDQLKAGDEVQQRLRDGQAIVIVARAGEQVPVDLDASLPFAKLSPGNNKVTFTRDSYVYVGRDGMLIGFDGTHFAPVGDWAAIKKLAGAKEGSVRIGAGVKKDEGVRLSAGFDVK